MRGVTQQRRKGLSPAAVVVEFVVVWLAVAGIALAGWPDEITSDEWLAFAVLLPIIAAVHLVGAG
jgi:hypothetical protein